MTAFKNYTIFSIFLLLFSCKNKTTIKAPLINKKAHTNLVIINVQPFENISATLINDVAQKLRTINKNIIINPTIALPKNSYYAVRNRYKADTILRFLQINTTINHVTLGLTNKDISTAKNQINDWGVMGLGFQPGNACIVSTYRIKKENLTTDLFKVCIHELGHTAGLPHCPQPTCFMRDANGGYPLKNEIEFCDNCKQYLIKKGWQLH